MKVNWKILGIKFCYYSREKQPNVISLHKIFPNQILTNFKIIINKKEKEKKKKEKKKCHMSHVLLHLQTQI